MTYNISMNKDIYLDYDKDAEDYASTKHSGKPEHVPKEVVRKLRETIRQIVKENPAAAAAAFQAMQGAKVKNPQTGRVNKITTAYYRPPEQFKPIGEPRIISPLTDTWSFGATLYELLSPKHDVLCKVSDRSSSKTRGYI